MYASVPLGAKGADGALGVLGPVAPLAALAGLGVSTALAPCAPGTVTVPVRKSRTPTNAITNTDTDSSVRVWVGTTCLIALLPSEATRRPRSSQDPQPKSMLVDLR